MARILKDARRRTKVVGAFPNGHSALMLVAARLRHVSATQWGTRKYMNIKLLEEMDKEAV
jgi:transposase-like protein